MMQSGLILKCVLFIQYPKTSAALLSQGPEDGRSQISSSSVGP